MIDSDIKCCHIEITGIVQGVGFRPYVYRMALERNLKGWVLNSSAGVFVEVEGPYPMVEDFIVGLKNSPPPLAVLQSFEVRNINPKNYTDFRIRFSEKTPEQAVMISPDIAICEDCKREVRDPKNRRYGYPFTNCTNCGPRFTIIKDVPYDRAMTTMAPFPMCPQCQSEYNNPRHRRFHAQPNACPVCGPQAVLLDGCGRKVDITPVEALKKGLILAVKGLGGFHLAADASSVEVVQAMRKRKKRDAKPFAVMVRDIDTAYKYCDISPLEEKCLISPQAPIVILNRKNDNLLPDKLIHPGLNTLGVMLPYTPLHYLLFDEELDVLIMTSANISDEPLIITNVEAQDKLKGMADLFLVHNREIYNPCDDSVARVTRQGDLQFMRRARGYVPRGIKLPIRGKNILALGGEMKNTFCLTRDGQAYLSQHWGDLNHYDNYQRYQDGIRRFEKMLAVKPEIIAHDLHPDYQTTRLARQEKNLPVLGVQHHHAHMAAVMAENGLTGEALGVVCDGTGWGLDQAVWGFEIFKGSYKQFERCGHLQYVPLPGGDLTARKPYRMALVYLFKALGEKGLELAERLLPQLSREERQVIVSQLEQGIKVVPTSSCGRLFDAVSALLGVCSINHYEGQAPIELEAAAADTGNGYYNYLIEKHEKTWIMNVMPMWHELVNDLQQKKSVAYMARKFHLTLVEMIVAVMCKLREETGLNRVVLSGGVFHNQLLLYNLQNSFEDNDFAVYQHRQVPPGDGGLCLGQAVIASEVTT